MIMSLSMKNFNTSPLIDDLIITTDHTLDMHETAESFNYEQKLFALEKKYQSNYRVLIQSRHMSKSTKSEKINFVQKLLKLKLIYENISFNSTFRKNNQSFLAN